MSEVKADITKFCSSCVIYGASLLLISVYLDTLVLPAELRDGVDMFQKLKQRNAHNIFWKYATTHPISIRL